MLKSMLTPLGFFPQVKSNSSFSSSPISPRVLSPKKLQYEASMCQIHFTDNEAAPFVSAEHADTTVSDAEHQRQSIIDFCRGYHIVMIDQSNQSQIIVDGNNSATVRDEILSKFTLLPEPAKKIIFSLTQIGLANAIIIQLCVIFANAGISIANKNSRIKQGIEKVRDIKQIIYNDITQEIVFIEPYFIESVIVLGKSKKFEIKGSFEAKYIFKKGDSLSSEHQVKILFPLVLLKMVTNYLGTKTGELTALEQALLDYILVYEHQSLKSESASSSKADIGKPSSFFTDLFSSPAPAVLASSSIAPSAKPAPMPVSSSMR